MLKHNLHKILLVFLSCFLVFTLAAPVQAAAPKKEPGMLTSPPPAEDFVTRYVPGPEASTGEITTQAFSPYHLYLVTGDVQIGVSGTGNLSLGGSTTANTNVQTIGIGLTVQRWTGSYWVQVYKATDRTLSNVMAVMKSDETTAVKGYYYRTVGKHWINHNGVYEEGTTYGTAMAYN